MSDEPRIKNIIVNRKARHAFFLHDSFEAGVSLVGSEVKSLRAGKVNLQEAFVQLKDDGAWLMGCHISPYTQANRNNHEPLRPRQLLLRKSELLKLRKATQQRGMTIVPVRLYWKGNRVKVEIATAKGKKQHDKRESLKSRDAQRDMDRHGRR